MKSNLDGSRSLSNLFWALAVSLGGLGFFLNGLSSYFKTNLIFSSSSQISFIPQGIVLVFYGTVGLILGIFLWLTIWWDVGAGYNDFVDSNANWANYSRMSENLGYKQYQVPRAARANAQ